VPPVTQPVGRRESRDPATDDVVHAA
jgi:hypothetical protein